MKQYITKNSKRFGTRKKLWKGRTYSDGLARLAEFCMFKNFGSKSIDEITTRDCEDFFVYIQVNGSRNWPRPLSPKSVNRYRAALSCMFKYAVRMGDRRHTPDFRWDTEKQGRIRTFSTEELDKLFYFFDTDRTYSKHTWLRDMAIVALYTGLRLGEMKEIGRRATLTQCGNFQHLPSDICKSGKYRNVPVSHPTAFRVIKRLGNLADKFSSSVYEKAWLKARAAICPGDREFTGHTLRHTCVSHMAYELNLNLKVIQDALGHLSPATTLKYAHVKDEKLLEVQQSLDFGVNL